MCVWSCQLLVSVRVVAGSAARSCTGGTGCCPGANLPSQSGVCGRALVPASAECQHEIDHCMSAQTSSFC